MFFDSESATRVREVLYLKRTRKTVNYRTPAREYGALSYRISERSILNDSHKTVEADRNSILHIPKNLSYVRDSTAGDLIVIHFDIYSDAVDSLRVFYPEQYEEYRLMFKKIYEVWQEKNVGYEFKCNEIFNRILYKLSREQSISGENADAAAAERAARIIEKHLSDSEFSLAELSRELKISDAYLRIKFREKYGMSLKEYQIKIRLERAKWLLSNGYYNVKESAYHCGFSNEKYFSALFKKTYGCTPKEMINKF